MTLCLISSQCCFRGVRRGRLSRRSLGRRQGFAGRRPYSGRPVGQSSHRVLRGRRVGVGDLQHFKIHESSDFQRPNTIVSMVGVVATRLVAVEVSRIDGGVTSAFLDRRIEEHRPRLRRNPCKPRAEYSVVRQPLEVDLVEDTGHLVN